MGIVTIASTLQWSWSLGLLWLLAAGLFGGGYVLCGSVVALGPPSPNRRSASFQIGRMAMLLGLLMAVAAFVVTGLVLVT